MTQLILHLAFFFFSDVNIRRFSEAAAFSALRGRWTGNKEGENMFDFKQNKLKNTAKMNGHQNN